MAQIRNTLRRDPTTTPTQGIIHDGERPRLWEEDCQNRIMPMQGGTVRGSRRPAGISHLSLRQLQEGDRLSFHGERLLLCESTSTLSSCNSTNQHRPLCLHHRDSTSRGGRRICERSWTRTRLAVYQSIDGFVLVVGRACTCNRQTRPARRPSSFNRVASTGKESPSGVS